MIDNIIVAAAKLVVGISALWVLLFILPCMWKEQKKINALLRQMRKDNSDG